MEKTAFSIPRGYYQMNVLPFGLCNSQSTFQRILDTALATITNTESYVEDCVTHSKNFEQHMKDLRLALGACGKLEYSSGRISVILAMKRGNSWPYYIFPGPQAESWFNKQVKYVPGT